MPKLPTVIPAIIYAHAAAVFAATVIAFAFAVLAAPSFAAIAANGTLFVLQADELPLDKIGNIVPFLANGFFLLAPQFGECIPAVHFGMLLREGFGIGQGPGIEGLCLTRHGAYTHTLGNAIAVASTELGPVGFRTL